AFHRIPSRAFSGEHCPAREVPMLDLTHEQPIPLAIAAALVPPARNGKRTHFQTLYRWVIHGATGPSGTRIRLEAIRLGGRWMTSREALQRFAERLTPN